MEIAYVNYGFLSGVAGQVRRSLEERGHRVASLDVVGPLEYRDPKTRRLRMTPEVALHLAWAVWKFGKRGTYHRWNTEYAFDLHSRHAGVRLAELGAPPDVILQSGALFAPGMPPPAPYVLLLDNTRQLAMERPAEPAVGLEAPPDYGEGWRRREQALYLGAAAIGTYSKRVVRSLEKDYGVPAGRAEAVGAGANVFPERPERADDGQTIIFVGTRFDLKGGPVLLKAFERIRRTRPGARLIIVGPTERIALPMGASHLGYLPAWRLEGLFREASVFVLPTLREAFGIAFLDAMACAVPCIGTDVEAVPEIIDDGRTGVLVPPSDDVALAAAIERVLADRSFAAELGRNGREKVEAGFRWSHVAERLERLLLRASRPRVERHRRSDEAAMAPPDR